MKYQQLLNKEVLKPAVLILALALLARFLPNEALDPWGVFNINKFVVIVLSLAMLEFAGYFLSKILGQKRGALLLGFLGGLVSSTVVLLNCGKQSSKSTIPLSQLVVSTMAAQLAAIVEVVFIIGLISPALLRQLFFPLASAFLVASFAVFKFFDRNPDRPPLTFDVKSPLQWRGIVRLALVFSAILIVIAMAKSFVNEQATAVISFISGMFELHGVTLANATMFAREQLSLRDASANILLAATASFLAKSAVAWLFPREFAKRITIFFLSMIIVIWLPTVLGLS